MFVIGVYTNILSTSVKSHPVQFQSSNIPCYFYSLSANCGETVVHSGKRNFLFSHSCESRAHNPRYDGIFGTGCPIQLWLDLFWILINSNYRVSEIQPKRLPKVHLKTHKQAWRALPWATRSGKREQKSWPKHATPRCQQLPHTQIPMTSHGDIIPIFTISMISSDKSKFKAI